jgi:ribonuclease VapC
MSEFVLDASALLTLLNAEKGSEMVQGLLPNAVISAVNMAEVVARLAYLGMPESEIRNILALLGLEIVPFDSEQAFQAGFLFLPTRSHGLSLGDRSCLALAKAVTATAVTADQAWGDLNLEVGIKLVR